MGNIKTLKRDALAIITYAYTGNKLTGFTSGLSGSYTYDVRLLQVEIISIFIMARRSRASLETSMITGRGIMMLVCLQTAYTGVS